LHKVEYFKNRPKKILPGASHADFAKNKKAAYVFAKEKLAHYNQFFGFKYNKIAIKAQKTRWGSCSRRGNLNFNYRIALLPERLADYIIVHELCHLKEMNHSKRFWNLVARAFPDYQKLRHELKNIF
jgi:predicted metal-dependent hydrolase